MSDTDFPPSCLQPFLPPLPGRWREVPVFSEQENISFALRKELSVVVRLRGDEVSVLVLVTAPNKLLMFFFVL